MPRPRKNKKYTELKKHTVFVLTHPFTKEFYVGYTLSHNMRSTYKDHYIEAKYKTANMVACLKRDGFKPCCFALETLDCTKVEAYNRVVVWTKILMENGYEKLDKGDTISYANDLLDKNIPLYEERKNVSLEEHFNCQNCLFPDYGRQMCRYKGIPMIVAQKEKEDKKLQNPDNKTEMISLRFRSDELEQVRKNAASVCMTVSAYIRATASELLVYRYHNKDIIEHTHQITAMRNAINQLIYSIRRTGEYIPSDLEYIIKQMDELTKSEEKLRQYLFDEQDNNERIFKMEIRRIIRQRLESLENKKRKQDK